MVLHGCVTSPCPICTGSNGSTRRVAEIEYYPNGMVKKVRYADDAVSGPWHGGETK